jgi:hypothetical protein
MCGACGTHGEKINTYRISVGKREGKRPFGRSRHRREDNMRIYLREMWWEHVNRMGISGGLL